MQDEVMIAGNMAQAKLMAEVTLGWRTCARGWLKPDGTVVRYASEPHQLAGLPVGTVVHVDYSFYRRPSKEIEEFMAFIRPKLTVRGYESKPED